MEKYEKQLLERKIVRLKAEIKNINAFIGILPKALKMYRDDHYKTLIKACEKWGYDFEDIRNAYGYGYISKEKFEKLDKLFKEMDNDAGIYGVKEITIAYLEREVRTRQQQIENNEYQIEKFYKGEE